MKNSTLEKLIAHERSARAIGSLTEADNYARKIAEIKKKMPAVKTANPYRVIGDWRCSCGFSISLDINGGKTAKRMADLILAPHKFPGHRLTKIS